MQVQIETENQSVPVLQQMFSGKRSILLEMLIENCPGEFKKDNNNHNNNPWVVCARHIINGGANFFKWKWKTDDTSVVSVQMGYFFYILNTEEFKGEKNGDEKDREAVIAWIISEILSEIPS